MFYARAAKGDLLTYGIVHLFLTYRMIPLKMEVKPFFHIHVCFSKLYSSPITFKAATCLCILQSKIFSAKK